MNHLLTPRDWQAQALREANELLGTHEGAAKLAEARRYEALADELERWRARAAAQAEPLRHATKENGDCAPWCNACRVERDERAAAAQAEPLGWRHAVADLLKQMAALDPSAFQAAAQAGDELPPTGQVYGIIDPDYGRAYTIIRKLAWEEGYAIGMHGSFTRDLDLIAVPWTNAACEPEHLIRRILAATKLTSMPGNPGSKPQGRLVWTLPLPEFGDPRFIDLSVMPTAYALAARGAQAGDELPRLPEQCGFVDDDGDFHGVLVGDGNCNVYTAAQMRDYARAALAARGAQAGEREAWIPVTERLPEEGAGEVLVWLTGGRCAFDEWHMHCEDPTGMGGPTMEMGFMWRDYDFEEVTHWMPLPATPGGKK